MLIRRQEMYRSFHSTNCSFEHQSNALLSPKLWFTYYEMHTGGANDDNKFNSDQCKIQPNKSTNESANAVTPALAPKDLAKYSFLEDGNIVKLCSAL